MMRLQQSCDVKLLTRAALSRRRSCQTNANNDLHGSAFARASCSVACRHRTHEMSGLPPRPDFVPPLPPPRRADDVSPRPDRLHSDRDRERRDRDRDFRYREPPRGRPVLDTYIPGGSSAVDTYMPSPSSSRRPAPFSGSYIADTYIPPSERDAPRFRERSPPPRLSPPPRYRERSPPPRARYPSPDRERDRRPPYVDRMRGGPPSREASPDRERERRPPLFERIRGGPPPRDITPDRERDRRLSYAERMRSGPSFRDDWRTREDKLLPRPRGPPPPRDRRDYDRRERSPERPAPYYDSRVSRRSRSPARRSPRMLFLLALLHNLLNKILFLYYSTPLCLSTFTVPSSTLFTWSKCTLCFPTKLPGEIRTKIRT